MRVGESAVAGLGRAQKRKIEKQVGKEATAYYRENAAKFADAYQGPFQQKLNTYFGVLCFSTVNDNLLMWAHYADSHKGFVLEFDTEDEQFRRLGDLHPITYDTNRPVLDPVKQITFDIYLRKSLDWQYEHEYRLVRPLQECEKRSLVAGEFYFVPMPRSCVKAVYLGTRMNEALAKQILELMAGTSAEICETELHPRQFSLVFKRIE